MKNITFTADEELIAAACAQAKADNTTLNEQFQVWLAQYARKQRVQRFREVIDELEGKLSACGRKFTRDEMNKR